MAGHCSAFSPDGQYWACCGVDGKLQIWATATSRIKQEYVPNQHLSSPCSVLEWIQVHQRLSTNTKTPPKRQRKKQCIIDDVESKPVVAMGTVNGSIILWDVAASQVGQTLDNGHTAAVSALTWSSTCGLFSAADDARIVQWNIQESEIKCRWKSGKSKATALAATDDGKYLVSADRMIKVWELSSKRLLMNFTGHASQVTFLRTIRVNESESRLISGASGDGYLGVWSLDEERKDGGSVGTLTMQDDAVSVSVKLLEDSRISILAANRSGQAHLFVHGLNDEDNSKTKPMKPRLNIAIALDSEHKETVQQIPIRAAELTIDGKLMLAYGSMLDLTFEKIAPDYSDTVQLLLRRADISKSKDREDQVLTKLKVVDTEAHVEYLPTGTTTVVKRNRANAAGSQLPLKERLENLGLNTETSAVGKILPSKGGANMAQLLMQGLNSKDKTILTSVIMTKNETVIKRTCERLPVQAVVPLIKELALIYETGKTLQCQIAVEWLKALVSSHASYLMSYPDIGDVLGPFMALIAARTALYPAKSRLRARLARALARAQRKQDDRDIMGEALLVHQDQDSSDEDTAAVLDSESDDNCQLSESELDELENGKFNDLDSICS